MLVGFEWHQVIMVLFPKAYAFKVSFQVKKKKSRISMTLQVFQIRWTPCLVFLTYRFPSQEPPEHEIIFTKLDTQSFKQFV